MLAESFLRSGKVRDLYALDDDRLLLVASDRISRRSTSSCRRTIPDKGRVLTGLSRFWFARDGRSIIPNHLLGTDPRSCRRSRRSSVAGRAPTSALDAARPDDDLPAGATSSRSRPSSAATSPGRAGRSTARRGTVCGIALPPGLRESDRLPEPIFTPATKAERGAHDENISFDGMIEHMAACVAGDAGAGALAEAIRDLALRLYRYGVGGRRRGRDPARRHEVRVRARCRGAEGSATGPRRGRLLTLIDEALTPDSSRFWDAATYEPGRAAGELRQAVRARLARGAAVGQDGARARSCPTDVVDGTRARYVEAYERITGASFERYLEEDVIAR